ncbi:hypothetical protein LCGC14_0294580 [marine sediment metagenome]|uniref:Uncharacterized protein n=1 Tax=marine sediment metagenome TaxID=412755 RepID=A0A0F9TS15_9ZZZZ
MTNEEYKAKAIELWQEDGEVEIDDNADVVRGDHPDINPGAYVQAWVWVPSAEEEGANTK